MKVPKTANPYGVSTGQTWKRKRKDRPNKFVIKEFEKEGNYYFAAVEYGKDKKAFTRKINLANFGEYQRVK